MQGPLREFETIRQSQRDISHVVRDIMQARGRLGDVVDHVLGFLLPPVAERVTQRGETVVYTTDAGGLNHGLQREWYENDQKYRETHYEHGKKHGLQQWWYENGHKTREIHWDLSIIVLASLGR